MTKSEAVVMRFFVDERSGCVAVRDRKKTDPEYQGLHTYTAGVVRYWAGTEVMETCPTCRHTRFVSWTISEEALKAAQDLCKRLNDEHNNYLSAPEAQEGGK